MSNTYPTYRINIKGKESTSSEQLMIVKDASLQGRWVINTTKSPFALFEIQKLLDELANKFSTQPTATNTQPTVVRFEPNKINTSIWKSI